MEMRPRKKQVRLMGWALGLLVLVVGLLAWAYHEGHYLPGLSALTRGSSQTQTPSPGAHAEPRKVQALGRLEPEGGVINVSVPLADLLDTLFVQEGESVKKGQQLARLQSYWDRKASLDLAEAQLQEAQARKKALEASSQDQIHEAQLHLDQLKITGPLDIQAQKDNVQLLAKQLANAHTNLSRLQSLRGEGISQQDIEQQQLLTDKAEVELASAQSLLTKLKASFDLNVKSAEAQLQELQTKTQAEVRQIPVESLQKSVDLARMQLDHSLLVARDDGTILQILAHPGEMVGGQPLLKMADTRQMMAVAEVYETDIQRVRKGQKATVKSRALEPNELTGTVQEVGTIISKNTVYDIDPTADADRRVLKVKVRLDDSAAAARLINLQVTVTIQVEEEGESK